MQNGWNLTGDAYLMDADGYFFYQARTDDMIISAGYNIAGPEVESALLLHPAVAECAVVGGRDEERGQIVKAFVVLRAGHAADDALAKALQDFVKQTHRAVQVSARDRVPRRAAAHRDRQAAALSPAAIRGLNGCRVAMASPGAGYSGTPLVKKLGIQPGMTVQVIDAPRPYEDIVEGLPADLRFVRTRDGHHAVRSPVLHRRGQA